jgi:hypothetical protein
MELFAFVFSGKAKNKNQTYYLKSQVKEPSAKRKHSCVANLSTL